MTSRLIAVAHDKKVSGFVGDGANRWPYRSGKRDPHGGEPRVASSATTAGVVRRSERWTNLWSD